MMNHCLTDTMKREVIALIGQYGASKRGIVTSYQPQPPMVKVQLMPPPPPPAIPVDTGWIPVLSQWVGNGWGLVAPLVEGAQVYLGCEEADGQNYVCLGQYYSAADPAPTGAAEGEIILQHESGASFRLANDGSINLLSETLNIAAPGGGAATVNITGQIIASGNIKGAEFVAPSLPSYNDHTHTSQSPGTPTSAPIGGT